MRRAYLVCYDVRNAKRLRRVHKTLKGFGEPWQYSVFFCCLREIDRVRMQTALEAELNLKEDACLILDLGGDEEAARDAVVTLGESLPDPRGTMTVI
ncbi:MAG: CRISPR-associated endonuclease Cas2 [Verrucomicrobia bacterium]|nr:CRISPR-associated endonuclease Cas2 [Verrucomicrobiota bacterium]